MRTTDQPNRNHRSDGEDGELVGMGTAPSVFIKLRSHTNIEVFP